MLLFFRGGGEARGFGKTSELENFCHNCIYVKAKIDSTCHYKHSKQ